MVNFFHKQFGCYPSEYFFPDIIINVKNPLIIDLFDIFGSIYYMDIMNKHNKTTEENGRNLDVSVLVTDKGKWEDNKSIIEKIAKFVSEDNWNINFESGELNNVTRIIDSSTEYKTVTLISGGLDSFCGAYHNTSNNIDTLYCGYKLNKVEQHYQKIILDFILKEKTAKSKIFNKIGIAKEEPTQRTRSLLFLSIACMLADVYNINEISLFENGILSLNPEFYSRQTTKTTHPKTIYLFNKLLRNIDIDIKIEHPFMFNTKGEIINNLSNNFKEMIKDTYTCGTSRQHPHYEASMHCGVCIPCILRKISIAAYDLEDYDREYDVAYGYKISDAKPKQQGYYKSSNEYFMMFKDKIDNGEIYSQLELRRKYYNDEDYLNKTAEMLKRFSCEVERYYSKYPLW